MKMRVIDEGSVGALRSQSLWHGIASAMTVATPVTLSFCRPTEPYVCLGYHRSTTELDLEACAEQRIPVLRRRLGGGPVWIDGDQLFFQLTMPAGLAPPSVRHLYERCLGPAVSAFRTLGLEAELCGANDIAIGDRKVSGTAAGRIDDGVTVVGNFIFRFPHERMTRVLAFPDDAMRRECLRLMRRHVVSHDTVREADVKRALIDAYARSFGAVPEPDTPSEDERHAIARWESTMTSRAWLDGVASNRNGIRQVKISAAAWVTSVSSPGLRVQTSIVDGAIDRIVIEGESDPGMQAALCGSPARLDELSRRLDRFPAAGARMLELLRPALEVR